MLTGIPVRIPRESGRKPRCVCVCVCVCLCVCVFVCVCLCVLCCVVVCCCVVCVVCVCVVGALPLFLPFVLLVTVPCSFD